MPQQPTILRVTSPVRGINRVTGREQQPPETCWDCSNVLPFDKFGRKRVAQRHGLVKQWSSTLGSTRIQGMLSVNNITYSGSIGTTSTIPVTSFSHVPAGVTTSSSSITWPAHEVPSGGDPGVVVNSTMTDGLSLTFNLIFSGAGSTTNAASDLYMSLNQGSTSWNNPVLGNDTIDVLWQYNPVSGAVHVEVDGNPLSGFVSVVGNSTASPANSLWGSTIPCTFTWDGSGNASATFGALGTAGSINVPPPASTMQFWTETGTSQAIEISNINATVGTTVSSGQASYQTLLISVCQGNVWMGDSSGHLGEATYSSTLPSTARISSSQFVSMAYANGQVFIADGSSTLWNLTIASSTVNSTTAVASPGNITGTVPPNCNLCCTWRGRIVVAGDSNNPQNWYMSRPAGTYFNTATSTNVNIGPGVDWDYSQTDSAAAVAGNTAHAGQIGDPITALIPFSDDYLKFGGARSLWMAQGDPAAGGSIVNVSNSMGILGKDAWCVDPAGTLWFVATGGLFRVRPAWEFYRPPESVSMQTANDIFRAINPSLDKVMLVYDPDLYYLHTFVTPLNGTSGTHMTMDIRSEDGQGPFALWPQVFPSTCGPTASCVFYSSADPNTRSVLMGGQDGYIRQWAPSALDDDGTAISASVTLGPFNPVPGEAAVLVGTTIDLGEVPVGTSSTDWNVNVILASGPDAYTVTEGVPNSQDPRTTPTIQMTLDKRQKTIRQRMRGGWFTMALQNLTGGKFFAFESAVMEFIPGGRLRNIR